MDRGRLIPYLIIAVLGVFLYFQLTKDVEIVEVPVRVEVPVPVVKVEFDTILDPYPVYIEGKTIIDSTYFEKYINLKDSVEKRKLFIEAIAIRDYHETVEDDTLKIDINMRVQGFLKSYQVSYKTKPRTILLDTILPLAIPKRSRLYGSIETVIPTNQFEFQPVLKVGLMLKTKSDRIYSVSIDTDGRLWGGFAYPF